MSLFHWARLVYAEWASQYVHPADDYLLDLSRWRRESAEALGVE